MASKLFLLLLLQALAVMAAPNFLAALEFHEKRQTPQQALSACSVANGVLGVCEAGVPGFFTLAPAAQAACACYSGDATATAWLPDAFDGAVKTCASAARTLDTSVYEFLQSFDNLCQNAGNVRAATATLPVACTTVLYAIGVCNSAIPGLSTLGAAASAGCLCYDTTTWQPNRFDNAVESCAAFLQTASPPDFEAIRSLNGFCSIAGDVLKPASAPATTTSPIPINVRSTTTTAPIADPNVTPVVTTTAAATRRTTAVALTGVNTFPACSAVGSAIASCETASPGFTTAGTASQAACICYTRSTSWVPDRFDAPVSSCLDFVQTAAPENYSLYDNLRGFCSFVGDIYSTSVVVTTTSARSATAGGGGGGVSAGGGSVSLRTSTTSVANPGPTTPSTSSSRAGAAPTGSVDYWALQVISVVVIIQAFA